MNAVVTVVGKDMVGIIHKVSGKVLEHNLNILDINQSVVGDYFTMIMLIDITNIGESFEKLCSEFDEIGKEIGQKIIIQHENLFNAMHTI